MYTNLIDRQTISGEHGLDSNGVYVPAILYLRFVNTFRLTKVQLQRYL